MASLVSQTGQHGTDDVLTVIITTSPTPSAPSTELLEWIFASYKDHCPFLLRCKVVVVFDTYDHVALEARLKKGHVTLEQATAYDEYKARVKKLVLASFSSSSVDDDLVEGHGLAEFGMPRVPSTDVLFTTWQSKESGVTFVEPSKRLGFGLAVRSALRLTQTPYVFIHQHDWALVNDVPILPLLGIMQASESDASLPVKYVCLPAARLINYAASAHVLEFPALRELTAQLKRDFTASTHPETKVPLTPLFFWHDKPHVASTSHYLAQVFPSRLAMMRGDFIEDKIGQRARQTMKDGMWAKWACWLYYPDDGRQVCVKHLQGRTWRGKEGQARQNALYRELHRQKAEEEEDTLEAEDAKSEEVDIATNGQSVELQDET